MRRIFAFVLLLTSLVVLNGCATPAYNSAFASCSVDAATRFPEKLKTYTYKESYQVRVPTGKTRCETTPAVFDRNGEVIQKQTTECIDETTLETRYRDAVGSVDANASARFDYASRCAAAICLKTIGESRCKIGVKPYDQYLGTLDRDSALSVLRGYYPADWVAKPYGSDWQNLGLCGSARALPFESMRHFTAMPDVDGTTTLSVFKFNWLTPIGPCITTAYHLRGMFSQQEIDRIAEALKSLGVKF